MVGIGDVLDPVSALESLVSCQVFFRCFPTHPTKDCLTGEYLVLVALCFPIMLFAW
jgi:hypothetical protein